MTLTQTDIDNLVLSAKSYVGKRAANIAKKSDYGDDIGNCEQDLIVINKLITVLCSYDFDNQILYKYLNVLPSFSGTTYSSVVYKLFSSYNQLYTKTYTTTKVGVALETFLTDITAAAIGYSTSKDEKTAYITGQCYSEIMSISINADSGAYTTVLYFEPYVTGSCKNGKNCIDSDELNTAYQLLKSYLYKP